MTAGTPDDLMTVMEAARILGLSPDMVRLLHKGGRLAALRTTRGVRLFRRADVEHLAAERRKERERRLQASEGLRRKS
jgi:excisionase family DNA binding protein